MVLTSCASIHLCDNKTINILIMLNLFAIIVYCDAYIRGLCLVLFSETWPA